MYIKYKMTVLKRFRKTKVTNNNNDLIFILIILISCSIHGYVRCWTTTTTTRTTSSTSSSLFSSYLDVRQNNVHNVLSNDRTFQSFVTNRNQQNHSCAVYCGMNIIPPELIQDIKMDAILLQQCGFGSIAKVVSEKIYKQQQKQQQSSLADHHNNNDVIMDDNNIIRREVHQIWIRTIGSMEPLNALVGHIDGRLQLIRTVELIRSMIEVGPYGPLHSNLMELSYVSYEPGSYYKKHVDVIKKLPTTTPTTISERSVSFLLYLGDPNDSNKNIDDDNINNNKFDDEIAWNCTRDGGALRIYGQQKDADGQWITTATSSSSSSTTHLSVVPNMNNTNDTTQVMVVDITPAPGTLLLFDSHLVPHEVMVTNRARVCVVGWFGKTKIPTI